MKPADESLTWRPRRAMATTIRRARDSAAVILALAFVWASPSGAQAELRRVALVIGNSSYMNAPDLVNPRNDALAIAATLRELGFVVQEGIDLDTAEMYRTVRAFGALAETADVALAYYAGHGIQVDGVNYLLPVDVVLERERDLNYEGMSADLLVSEVSQTRQLGVVILDACRNNPFTEQLQQSMGPTRSAAVGRGLARIDAAPSDTLIAFATRAGAVAEDGEGANSPYATALLAHMREPGLEIGQYFRRVRDTVLQVTNGRQEPFVYGSLSADEYYLNPPPAVLQQAAITPPTAPTAAPPASPGAPDGSVELEVLFWESIKGSSDPADFEAYIQQFPAGVFAGLARNRIATLAAAPDQAPSGPTSRTQAPPSLPDPPGGATALAVPPPPDAGLTGAEKREIQALLQRLGLYGGGIDGLFGPGTRAGIAAFQRSIGAPASGALSPSQITILRQEATAVPPLAAQTLGASTGDPPVTIEATATPLTSQAVAPAAAEAAEKEVAAVSPPPAPPGNFGAIATGGSPHPVPSGICTNMASQAEANACALAKCGAATCDIRVTFGSGQSGAFAEACVGFA